MTEKRKTTGAEVTIAVIGLIGVLATAIFSNWDKIFKPEPANVSVEKQAASRNVEKAQQKTDQFPTNVEKPETMKSIAQHPISSSGEKALAKSGASTASNKPPSEPEKKIVEAPKTAYRDIRFGDSDSDVRQAISTKLEWYQNEGVNWLYFDEMRFSFNVRTHFGFRDGKLFFVRSNYSHDSIAEWAGMQRWQSPKNFDGYFSGDPEELGKKCDTSGWSKLIGQISEIYGFPEANQKLEKRTSEAEVPQSPAWSRRSTVFHHYTTVGRATFNPPSSGAKIEVALQSPYVNFGFRIDSTGESSAVWSKCYLSISHSMR